MNPWWMRPLCPNVAAELRARALEGGEGRLTTRAWHFIPPAQPVPLAPGYLLRVGRLDRRLVKELELADERRNETDSTI